MGKIVPDNCLKNNPKLYVREREENNHKHYVREMGKTVPDNCLKNHKNFGSACVAVERTSADSF